MTKSKWLGGLELKENRLKKMKEVLKDNKKVRIKEAIMELIEEA